MTGNGIPIRRQMTVRWVDGKTRGQVILLLYPDKLAAVSSRAAFIGMVVVGGIGTGLLSYVPPGVLQGMVAVAGLSIGAAVAQGIIGATAERRAAAKVAAGSGGVTVIPLDSIAHIETAKTKDRRGNQYLLVTTADGQQYGFGVKLDTWSADLTSALTACGREVHVTPEGMTLT